MSGTDLGVLPPGEELLVKYEKKLFEVEESQVAANMCAMQYPALT